MNITEEANKIIKQWKELISYFEEDNFYTKENISTHDRMKDIESNFFVDKNLVIELCQQGSDFFKNHWIKIIDFCSEEIKNDRDTVLAIVKSYGDNLELLKPEFKDDKEIVSEAVKSSEALKYASDRLKNDEDIVNLSIENSTETIEFASDRFKNNKEFCLSLLRKRHYLLDKVGFDLRNNPEFLLEFWRDVESRNYESIIINGLAARLINHLGKDLKPYFNEIDLDNPHPNDNLPGKIRSYLTSIILERELGNELNLNSSQQSRKIKI